LTFARFADYGDSRGGRNCGDDDDDDGDVDGAVGRDHRGRDEVGRQHERDVAEQHLARGGHPGGMRRRPRDREQAVRRRALHGDDGRLHGRRRWRRRRRRRHRQGRLVPAGAAVRAEAGHPAAALLPGRRLGLGDRGHGCRGARAQPRVPAVRGRHVGVRGRQAPAADRQRR